MGTSVAYNTNTNHISLIGDIPQHTTDMEVICPKCYYTLIIYNYERKVLALEATLAIVIY